MTVKRATLARLQKIASSLDMHLTDEHARTYRALLQSNFDADELIDSLPDHVTGVTHKLTAGHRPDAEENKYGATIAGGAVCECFCFLGGSHISSSRPLHNPRRMGYSARGSSSGSAALVDAGEVELAIGGDQGGSIRMPASYCGIYGIKRSYGLVPFTGIVPIEVTIDHTDAITASVADNALMLEALACLDGFDPRQHAGREAQPYTELMKGGVSGLRIGIVTEGFGWDNSTPGVDAQVRKAARRVTELGARVSEVSVPMNHLGLAIWLAVAAEGATQQMMKDNGHGFNWKGLYVTSMIDWYAGWRARADELSGTLKLTMELGEYFIKRYHGRFYANAQNLTRQLTQACDDAFNDFDLLLMPTVPITATKIPAADASIEENVGRALEMLANTAPLDCTGDPAMSIPCELLDGLPVGMMLVGRRDEEGTIYRGAYAFEQAGDWQSM